MVLFPLSTGLVSIRLGAHVAELEERIDAVWRHYHEEEAQLSHR